MFSLECTAMLFKRIECSHILENVLVLNDNIEHDQARRRRSEIRPTLIVLILTEDKLGLLRVMQALKKKAAEKHSNLLTVLE